MNLFIKHEKGSGGLKLLLILAVVLTGAVFLYWSWHSGEGGDVGGDIGGDVGGNAGGDAGSSMSDSPGSQDAAPFALYDVTGRKFSSSRLKGKPVVINFFTTWCPSCRAETPGFVEVYEQYKKNDFELIGVSIGETQETLSAFMASQKIKYTILIGDIETVRAYGGFHTVPTTFFIGKDWKIKNIINGYISRDDFEREVRELL